MTTDGEVLIFVDGSTIGNGFPHAKGSSAVVFPNGEMPDGAYYIPDQKIRTNNRMEFYAAIKAMELMNEYDPSKTKTLHVFTDSLLLLNTVTKWMHSWQRKGWKKSTPGEIKNLDLVKILYKHCNERKVLWTHVRAHQKDLSFETTWNNRVDKLAYSAVQNDDISQVISESPDTSVPKEPKIDTFFKSTKKRRIG